MFTLPLDLVSSISDELDIRSLINMSCTSKYHHEVFKKVFQSIKVPCQISIAFSNYESLLPQVHILIGSGSIPAKFIFKDDQSGWIASAVEMSQQCKMLHLEDVNRLLSSLNNFIIMVRKWKMITGRISNLICELFFDGWMDHSQTLTGNIMELLDEYKLITFANISLGDEPLNFQDESCRISYEYRDYRTRYDKCSTCGTHTQSRATISICKYGFVNIYYPRYIWCNMKCKLAYYTIYGRL